MLGLAETPDELQCGRKRGVVCDVCLDETEGVEDGTFAYAAWRLNYTYLGQVLGFYELYELLVQSIPSNGQPR